METETLDELRSASYQGMELTKDEGGGVALRLMGAMMGMGHHTFMSVSEQK